VACNKRVVVYDHCSDHNSHYSLLKNENNQIGNIQHNVLILNIGKVIRVNLNVKNVRWLWTSYKLSLNFFFSLSLLLSLFVWKHTRIQGNTPFHSCGQQFRYHGKQIKLNKFGFQWCPGDWIKVYWSLFAKHACPLHLKYMCKLQSHTNVLFLLPFLLALVHRNDVFSSNWDQNQWTPNKNSLF